MSLNNEFQQRLWSDLSHYGLCAFNQIVAEYTRPFVVMRPKLAQDGNAWIAYYGEDLATGVVGVGDTPYEAAKDFDKVWWAAPTHEEKK